MKILSAMIQYVKNTKRFQPRAIVLEEEGAAEEARGIEEAGVAEEAGMMEKAGEIETGERDEVGGSP